MSRACDAAVLYSENSNEPDRLGVRLSTHEKCQCGDGGDQPEFGWEAAGGAGGAVAVSADGRTVTFHPVYSAGTAAARADRPLRPAHHYYWEVRVVSEAYGTDLMVGLGTRAVDTAGAAHQFSSLLGADGESYGLSYRGRLLHAGRVLADTRAFGRGALVGVAVDTWRGTLQFYLDRQPLGSCVEGLRAHAAPLYPMLCSTAAQSVLQLTYAGSRPASLLAAAARLLPARAPAPPLPPGLARLLRTRYRPFPAERSACAPPPPPAAPRHPARSADVDRSAPQEARPGAGGLHADGVRREFRLVVRE